MYTVRIVLYLCLQNTSNLDLYKQLLTFQSWQTCCNKSIQDDMLFLIIDSTLWLGPAQFLRRKRFGETLDTRK